LEGFQARNYYFITENELMIELENKAKEVICPYCNNSTDKVHQSHWYRVRDIPCSSWDIFLNINRRQFRCRSCTQLFSEELNFIRKRRTYTKRLAKKVIEEVLETDIVKTAKRNRISPAEIETILKEVEEDCLSEKPTELKRLGIDEITHLKGGRNYVAVLVDIDKRKPIALLEKRNKETILEYLRGLGSELLNQIEEVSIDLWVPYKSVVEELIPNARIVADRFHVMKQINEELDNERKREKRAAIKIKNQKERAKKIEVITHSKYPLLKSKENLNEREKDKLAEVEKALPSLMQMYKMKEDFRDIFNRKITEDEAFWDLVEWMALAYQQFPKSCQTIKRWFEEILAYFNNRTTQGAVEGINQKIKLIKRRAYGLTNFANFRRRVLLNWHFCY
jgi:transposase